MPALESDNERIRQPLIIDLSSNAQTFLRYRDTNMLMSYKVMLLGISIAIAIRASRCPNSVKLGCLTELEYHLTDLRYWLTKM